MAAAAAEGVIDYSSAAVGSPVFALRERTLLRMFDARRRYEWAQALALRHAVLARGMTWLGAEHSAKVSGEHVEGMGEAEAEAMRLYFPHDERHGGNENDMQADMLEAYIKTFGGPPGSPEAQAEISRKESELLPPPVDAAAVAASTATDMDGAAARADWADRMKPRTRSGR
jgi:hypothetical protein